MAIGPGCRSDAQQVWDEITKKEMGFMQIIKKMRDECRDDDREVNKIVKSLRIHISNSENILIKSALEKRSIKVTPENGCVPIPYERRKVHSLNGKDSDDKILYSFERRKKTVSDFILPIPHELIEMLGEDMFIVVPLYSPSKHFGVIIADNFVTREPIYDAHISALELFASQASLAIEHSHHYMEMQEKIAELQALYTELDKNKDLLIEAERYAALGHMATQLVHAIRNPITSIGGVARIVAKKTVDKEWQKYLNVLNKETERLESTLEDLFDFVSKTAYVFERVPISSLIEKTVLLLQSEMVKQNITWRYDFPDEEPYLNVDRHAMQQAILHLVRNAIEAMPEGGRLNISVKPVDHLTEITVSDTGMGINKENLEKARDPFFTTKTYGTGLGLTMVDRIIMGHSGTFVLTEGDEGGMTATVRLPTA